MYKIIKTLLITAVLTIPTFCQVNQIEGKFIYHPSQNKFNNQDGYGGGIELTTSLGEYIKLLQSFSIEKSREGTTQNNFNQRDISFQSTFRLYPIEEYYSIKPFVQGGIRARNQRLSSNLLIPLPGDPGTLSTENKFTFISPFVGVGVNYGVFKENGVYKNYYILEYNYYLPDFSSKVLTDVFGQPDLTFHRERGHYLRAKGFIPLGDKFSFNPSYEVFRREFEIGKPEYDQTLSFGIGLKFGEK